MTLDEYQAYAKRTAQCGQRYEEALLNWTLGLGGEAGEFMNKVKKMLFHHEGMMSQDLAFELGDVLWYVAILANELGYTLNDVALLNVKKLAERYPDGYSHEASASQRL